MAPHDAKKHKIMKLTSGLDVDSKKMGVTVEKTNYALVGPSTQLVCVMCYTAVEDITQHTSKNSCCAIYLAGKYLIHLYEKHSESDWRPNHLVLAAMLEDEKCILTCRDIMAQKLEWNPDTDKFGNNGINYTVPQEVQNQTFRDIYDTYQDGHLAFTDAAEDFDWVPKAVFKAGYKACDVQNLAKWLKKSINTTVNAKVAQKVDDRLETRIFQDALMEPEAIGMSIDQMIDDGELIRSDDLDTLVDERIGAKIESKQLYTPDQVLFQINASITEMLNKGQLKSTGQFQVVDNLSGSSSGSFSE